jgi:uncharacterized protein with PIN domain
MLIRKCDVCKKIIKKNEKAIDLYFKDSMFESFELCEKCNQPIIKFLKNKKLIKKTGLK